MPLFTRKPLDAMARREQKTAYFLMAPTMLIILAIALYPLGSAFLKSFTNETFASSTPTKFVGLANYAELLSLRVIKLPPKESFTLTPQSLSNFAQQLPAELLAALDAAKGTAYAGRDAYLKAMETAIGKDAVAQYQEVLLSAAERQVLRDPNTQQIQYESAVRMLPREPVRYREVGQFHLFGSRYVIGARDPDFILAVKDTLLFTILTVSLETIFGMMFALIVNAEFPGRAIMRTLLLVPWAVPTPISSRMWQWMFQSTRAGFFNVILEKLGMGHGQIAFLQLESWQMTAMVAIDVWKTTPFMALLLLAGLQLIPHDIYEAADVDGATKFTQFWTITLPMLMPTLAVALVFRTLDALRVFDLFQIVLAQSRYSMGSFVYYELINNRAMGYSSAGGVIMFITIFLFAVTYIKMLGVQTEGD
ncbi:binding-protein-dependent transport systems inner membrane component [Candidatus Moduliflexus flocculans]|uniref:Binding-protein-dependent transport systems inner membrane component n=1 Tax=Candidatus Moduliflexus flocculans TaxID=1499966 RepID=A0A0S6W3H3_9BACT|nr:binding-protein-dependent transport systems inner membrane component [Candidatus Moduliflexus flocculans]